MRRFLNILPTINPLVPWWEIALDMIPVTPEKYYIKYCYRDDIPLRGDPGDGPISDLEDELTPAEMAELLTDGHVYTGICCDTYQLTDIPPGRLFVEHATYSIE